MFQMMEVFAESERVVIRERVLAGMKRVKARDKKLGRPMISPAEGERRGGGTGPLMPRVVGMLRASGVRTSEVAKLRPSDSPDAEITVAASLSSSAPRTLLFLLILRLRRFAS
jgi:hypothetical protein